MKNQVIEVLDREHGKKVIEYWKSKGVDTRNLSGAMSKEDGCTYRFYGVINGAFDYISINGVHRYNAEIIELPPESQKEEKPFPRVMLVSDDGDYWYKRVVFMKKCDRFLAWDDAETVEESEDIYEDASWSYAKELPEKIKITKAAIAEKFGISVDQLEIVD